MNRTAAQLAFCFVWLAILWPLSAQAARGGGQSINLELILTIAIGFGIGFLFFRFVAPFLLALIWLSIPFYFVYFVYLAFQTDWTIQLFPLTGQRAAQFVVSTVGSAFLLMAVIGACVVPSLMLWYHLLSTASQSVVNWIRKRRGL